ncbi:hypothetical protein [Capnocytophaga canimorsus]|uniref:hypothetical protein n=1 Tax=Capnocytophaga canimorsus TaxID=28188 RepID=UPI0037D44E70
MINLLKYSSLTQKMFSDAKKRENSIYKKCEDSTQIAGFSSQSKLIIIGKKYYYHFNEVKPEYQKELHNIFSSEWKNELYYGFAKFYAKSIKQEKKLYVLMLLGINTEKLSKENLKEAKDIGFEKKGSIFCEEDTGNFIYKSIHIAGKFAPKQQWKEKLKNEFPLKQKFHFTIEKESKLPKIGLYIKAIVLLPFALLSDLIAITLLYGTIGLVFLILKLKNLLKKD